MHYGIGVVPARSYKPPDKAKVELDRHLNISRRKPGFRSCCRPSCQFPDF
jgi:hypothetical protein